MTEEQIFLAALDRPDAVARSAYLDEACGENAALRQQVEALLASHFKSGEFMDVPAPEQISVEPSLSHAVTIQSEVMSRKDPDDERDSLHFLAPPTRPDSLGRIGHYEVLQVLGKGGFGIVFRAFDDVLQRVVAIKVMAPQMAATSPARKRFLREARTSAQVRHENVVQVYEVGEQPLPYLVMEFIPGETLQQKLDRSGPLDVPETLRIGRQIAEGLAAAHATDLIHRDIKPGNVLLEGGQHKVKITDFGLARAADDASMTQSGQIAGTPMYMAPEQALGETLDQRADLFSLGSVLYQMVAGRPPFRANTAVAVLKRVVEDTPRSIREVIPETPQWLCDIIAKLHAKKPDDRYQSAREVADVLADCEAQLKANSRLSDFSRIPQAKSVPRRSIPRKWAAAAVVLLIVLAGWFGSTPLLYLSNRGELKLLPEEGLISVIVLENNEGDLVTDKLHTPVTDWLDLTEKSHTLRLPPGRYQLNVSTWPAGTRVSQWAISNTGPFGSDRMTVPVIGSSSIVTVERGHSVTLRAVISKPAVAPTPVAVAPETGNGWVQLFNGKDLTGWKFPSDHPGHWEVKDGILRGSKRQSHLFSERGDYGNFHLRAEVKINLGGDSGLLFRAPLKLGRGRTPYEFGVLGCYEAELQQNRIHSRPTGSISQASGDAPPSVLGRVLDSSLTQPDEWFTYEVIAENNHFITKINGVEAVNCTDPQAMHQSGHLALQVWQSNTLVQFRKIEIRELPAIASSSVEPAFVVAPFDAAQAKAHQEAWARHLGVPVEREISLGTDDDGQDVRLGLVLIPPGEFQMGSSDEERVRLSQEAKVAFDSWAIPRIPSEGPQHRIRITKPFWLSKHEVTVRQFRRFAQLASFETEAERDGKGGVGFVNGNRAPGAEYVWNTNPGFPQTDDHPVVNVTWADSKAFCDWLSQQQEPAKFALPTEAQWEYACRAGTTTTWQTGNADKDVLANAWLIDNSQLTTQPVGQRAPNAFGLYDMHGNVAEWCQDWYSNFYTHSTTNDPVGPLSGITRVLRGGQFDWKADHARSAFRLDRLPTFRQFNYGFRVSAAISDDAIRAKLPPSDGPAAASFTNPPVADMLKDAVLLMNFEKDTFYEKDGQTYVRDLSGKGNDGLCEDALFTSEGQAGGGLACQGGRLALSTSLINRQANYTITMWVRANEIGPNLSAEPLYLTTCAGRPMELVYKVSVPHDKSVAVNAWNAAKQPEHWRVHISPLALVPEGEWFFLAVTLSGGGVDQGDLRVTVNDMVTQGSCQMVDSTVEDLTDFLGPRMTDGVLDEVAVFQRALSDEEIAVVRALGMRSPPPGANQATPAVIEPLAEADALSGESATKAATPKE